MTPHLPARIHRPASEPHFHIVNAHLATPDAIIANGSLQVDQGKIAAIQTGPLEGGGPRIDAAGALLIPGLVDLHSDANEKAIQPRPRARFPVPLAMQELDKVMAACGVTTVYHCVAFSNGQKGLRATQAARALIHSIRECREHLLCNTRIHLRYDITLVEALPLIGRLVDEGVVDLLSFMDHTPGQGQFASYAAFRDYLGRHHQYTDAEVRAVVKKRLADREAVNDGDLLELARRCRARGIPLASHDDDTAEKVRQLAGMGITISEFPVTLEAARAARAAGMHVAMGAPNLLMGKSTNGNLTAQDALREGLLDIVCSDYAPMTLLHAALMLARTQAMGLSEAVARFSLKPAEAAGIDGVTGSLTEGKRADMVLVDATAPVPRVIGTFVAGRQVYGSGW
jgi:alpha-D-ribose 1-methylphosphonate 5-triphosphate diphosphatase